MEFSHVSVLLNESINNLNIKPNGIYIDGTAGGAGHSSEIAKKLEKGMLIALDRDPDAVEVATERLKNFNATVVKSKYSDMQQVANDLGYQEVNGVLLDLGVSSFQLDNEDRGFSYHGSAFLDMRMSKSGLSAYDVINTYSVDRLTEIFRDYGEEKFAYRIANKIAEKRTKSEIKTTEDFAELIKETVPAAVRRDGHPARKCFQAVRIEVNKEFEEIENGIDNAFNLLSSGGRLCIITFHSLEDRIVKKKFASLCKGCICPPDLPICVCGRKPQAIQITRKPIIPSAEEISVNARSRSAKLRVLEKI